MKIKDMDANRLVFLDETGVNTQMSRRHARAEGGKRACGSVPCGHWRRVTILGALSLDGMLAAMTIEAATSAAVFLAYVQKVLIPALLRLKPNAVIVMDNLSAHKYEKVIQALVDAKFDLCFLQDTHQISRPLSLVGPRSKPFSEKRAPDLSSTSSRKLVQLWTL